MRPPACGKQLCKKYKNKNKTINLGALQQSLSAISAFLGILVGVYTSLEMVDGARNTCVKAIDIKMLIQEYELKIEFETTTDKRPSPINNDLRVSWEVATCYTSFSYASPV
jgi:hypothetical protein